MPEDVKQEGSTFQKKAFDMTTEAVQAMMQEVPELRSVVVVFDWREKLNQVAVPGLWLTSKGAGAGLDQEAVAEAPQQTLKMLNVQLAQADKILRALQKVIMLKTAELAERTQGHAAPGEAESSTEKASAAESSETKAEDIPGESSADEHPE